MKPANLISKILTKSIPVIVLILLLVQLPADAKDTVTFESEDGLGVTADLYAPCPNSAPFIILFHQAGWSRGEYIEIAPKLNGLDYNCLAVDLRSGGEINGIVNQTRRRAVNAGKGTDYLDAFADMKASVKYVESEYEDPEIIVWGSSYSASLVIKLAAEYPEMISGVLAFSPGEYFDKSDTYIQDSAGNIKCPVFITSAADETERWKDIFLAVPSENRDSFVPDNKGQHGSRALWSRFKESAEYWKVVKSFLENNFGKNGDGKGDSESEWNHPRSEEYIRQRRQMAEHIRRGYNFEDEKVLEAMRNVPRHWFVPEDKRDAAYMNSPLPIGYDQTISQPYIVAYMTSKLELDKNDKVLEIGTGSGYQAAVLSEFTPHVYTIEIVEPLARRAAKTFEKRGYRAIKTKIGDGYKGWQEYAPFDAIIITAAPEQIPQKLVAQLAEGGRMILPVGGTAFSQELLLVRKDDEGQISKERLMPVRFVPMIHGNSE